MPAPDLTIPSGQKDVGGGDDVGAAVPTPLALLFDEIDSLQDEGWLWFAAVAAQVAGEFRALNADLASLGKQAVE
ncbi:MAG: hypothetical protein NZ585_06340 [Chloracidobacterium sp.]|nr:hypothetical protein [Chloracidobacterium sp.]MDW8216080.1 hypothetical protein [Acidobacteriota bacterium]